MKSYLVVEGATDAAMLRAILPSDLLQNAVLTIGGGRSNIVSMARTLLVTRRKPVAVFADADTVDDRMTNERLHESSDLLASVAAGVPTKVILVVPEIEVLLFQAPRLLPRIFGKPIPEDVRIMANNQPKRALDRLLELAPGEKSVADVIKSIDGEDVKALRAAAPIHALIEFLQQAQRSASSSSTTTSAAS
jgi:hypothetical protein